MFFPGQLVDKYGCTRQSVETGFAFLPGIHRCGFSVALLDQLLPLLPVVGVAGVLHRLQPLLLGHAPHREPAVPTTHTTRTHDITQETRQFVGR